MFLDLTSCNFFLNFFYLIKINLYADVAFFNAKINFFIIILIVQSATLAIFVSWLMVRTDMTRANWFKD